MDALQNLLMGFGVALTPINLILCFLAVLAGTLIGVLPGIGPTTAIAILLPLTFGMNPTTGLIVMAGLYYGAMYGGSTTSVLINVPGETASVLTCLDGYQMARKGRPGPALAMAAISSFICGTIAVIGLMLLAPALVAVALGFGPPEYFALMLFALATLASLGGRSMAKSAIAVVLGLLFGMVGIDTVSGFQRFTFGRLEMMEGLNFVAAAVGLFAVAEVMVNSESIIKREVLTTKITNLYPTLRDWRDSIGAFIRGGLIGFFVGVLPGAGATPAAFLSYAAEKRFSKHPEKFGTGVIEGVAAPEGANNAAATGALVPLLALGIPGSGTAALMLGAMIMFGLRPGPLLMEQNPGLFWGLVASMYIGNIMLLVLNLPLVGMWVSLLKVPYSLMRPGILLFSFVGIYSLNFSLFDVAVMVFFGVLGYVMRKFGFPAAPLILALVLGPMVETALRQSLTMSHGSALIFLQRPISLGLMVLVVLALVLPAIGPVVSRRFRAVRTLQVEEAM